MRIHLFRGNCSQQTRTLQAFDKDIVGNDVELFLIFALDIFLPGGPEHPGKLAKTNQIGHTFAGSRDIIEQRGQGAAGCRFLCTAFNEVLCQIGSELHVDISTILSFTVCSFRASD